MPDLDWLIPLLDEMRRDDQRRRDPDARGLHRKLRKAQGKAWWRIVLEWGSENGFLFGSDGLGEPYDFWCADTHSLVAAVVDDMLRVAKRARIADDGVWRTPDVQHAIRLLPDALVLHPPMWADHPFELLPAARVLALTAEHTGLLPEIEAQLRSRSTTPPGLWTLTGQPLTSDQRERAPGRAERLLRLLTTYYGIVRAAPRIEVEASAHYTKGLRLRFRGFPTPPGASEAQYVLKTSFVDGRNDPRGRRKVKDDGIISWRISWGGSAAPIPPFVIQLWLQAKVGVSSDPFELALAKATVEPDV